MRLESRADGLLLIDELGRPLLFPDPDGGLQAGKTIRLAGANMELSLQGSRIEILHWHVASDDVERFCFEQTSTGIMPLSWIENLAGHRIRLNHDEKGRPTSLVQELEQRRLELEYGPDDLLRDVHFIDDAGQPRLMVHYDYDDARHLIASNDTLGNQCRYAYDDQHRLVAELNPLGSVFRFRYDSSGRCIHTWGNDRYMERKLQYLTAPPMTRVTDSLGQVTEYLLNAAGQVIQQISPLRATTTNEFDDHGRLARTINPDGGAIAYEYDERGNRKTFVDELGGVSKLEHNELHLMTRFVDPKGAAWVYEYDERGNLLALTNPLGARQECSRDHRGLVIESRRPGGLVSQRRYGDRLRSMEVRDQISLVMGVTVDELGNQTALYDAKGLVRQIKHDALGRPIEVTDALNRKTLLRYNGNNDLIERILPGGRWERWHYDQVGRMVAHENAAGTVRLEYDTEDRLLAVMNRAGETLTRTYDADGRMVSQRFFDGRVERYEYTARGLRTRQIKADGRIVESKYDKSGSLVARESSDGLKESFAYDETGKLVLARNASGSVELARDELGRVIAEVQNGRRVAYRFDIENNRTARQIDGIDAAPVAMRYDIRGRLTGLSDSSGLFQELRWDTDDQLAERRFAGGASERFTRDEAGRLREHAFFLPGGSEAFNQRFEYDDRDCIVAREEDKRGPEQLEYNALGWLTSVTHYGRVEQRYRHDANGSLLETQRGTRHVAEGGRTLADGQRQYHYGDDGCVSAIDAAEGRYELRHDVLGNLLEVTLPNGDSARYAYDALGRRILKEAPGERVEFVWQSCDLAAEQKNGDAPTNFFCYGQSPLAQWNGHAHQIPVLDQIGLPRLLLDERGSVLWRAEYDAYGEITAEKGDGRISFRFRGQYHDRETGFHYNFYRHYEPRLAGYLAPDPIGLIGGANFYAYPRNPLLWDDPFGLTCSNQHKGQMGEAEMDAHFAAQGYSKVGTHVGSQGIDGVYHNPTGTPPYIIGEAKYGSSRLGTTVHSGQQMSDHWIDTPIGGGGGPSRLESAVGPTHAAAIQASAASNPGSVQKQLFQLPAPGTPGTGSVTRTNNYTPGSGTTTF